MCKREIAIKVDEEIIEEARSLGVDDIATVANEAIRRHIERLARRAALGKWLDEMEEKHGPPSEEDKAWARAACDEAEGIIDGRGVA